MSTNPVVPLLSDLAPDGFAYSGQYMVEFDADSLWYETSLTIAALALQRGFKTEYHVFDHFPSEALQALSNLGVDAKRLEAEGLLSIWDSYTETTEFERAKTTGIGWKTAGEKPLNIVQGAESWVEHTKKGYAPDEMRWLHLDDNTGIFLQYNDEETVVDRWRTAILPAVRARECPHFLAFPKGIASEAFYTKFEALCDGIIDLKTEEVEGRVERFLRIRRLKGKVFDSRWQRLEVQADGAVRFTTAPSSGPLRRLAAIMFTDMVGYTSLAQADEVAALARIREQATVLRPLFVSYGGREIKSTGDGFLVEFESALKAVECAIQIQQRMTDRNAKVPTPPFLLRIGVHVGDVEEVNGDILGDAVNVASRITPICEPGGVCLSEQIVDHVRNKLPAELERLAPRRLKGIQEPLVVYRVVLPGVEREPSVEHPTLARLAVLPLANISVDPNDEYFADGLTEEMISVLSKISGLRVIARTSVAQYKGTTKPIAQIGAELGVTSVLEGSVRKAGDQLRISVQLIDVPTEEHRWAESYDRKLENIFSIQAEVAEQTASALKIEMLGPDRNAVRGRPTSNLVAYDLYLRGIQASRLFSPGARRRTQLGRNAAAYFEEAIRQDPQFSAAHSCLANHLLAIGGVTREGKEAFSKAREHVERALKIDPGSSDAHTARGNLLMQADFDWPRAEAELRKALDLNPSNSVAHFWYRSLLTVLQRYSEAKDQLDAGFKLDPLWFLSKRSGVVLLALSGDWDEAVRLAEGLVESARADPLNERESLSLLAWVYAYVGRPLDAERVDRQVRHPTDPSSRLARAVFLAWLGKPRGISEALATWERRAKTEYMSPFVVVQAYAQVGRTEEALSRLEQDLRNGESYLWAHYQLPYFDPIRDDPRFVAALEHFHLPTTQEWRRPAMRAHRRK